MSSLFSLSRERFLVNPIKLAKIDLNRGLSHFIPGVAESPGTGNELQQGDVQANDARQGSIVPEWWGRRKRYPESINQVHTYFYDKRTQFSKHALAVGIGEYEILQSNILVGDTPIGSFGTDADFDVYGPGASVVGDDRFDCWYECTDVGSTSSGTAGLDLASTQPSGSAVIADHILFNGKSATLYTDDSNETPEFPESWIVGTIIEIRAPIDVDVTENSSGYSELVGDFQDLEPFIGMKVTVSTPAQDFSLIVVSFTDNAGTDDILTFEDDDGLVFDSNDLADGAYRISISYRGHQYKITSISSPIVNFDRLTDDGTVDSGWSGFTSRDVYDFEMSSDEAGDSNWMGPFHAVPEGETTTKSELDFYFASGLIQYDKDDGDSHSLTLDITVEWRDSAISGDWTTVAYSFSEKTEDAIGFTKTIEFGSAIRPEIRVRREQAEEDTKHKTRRWNCQWLRLKSLLPYRPDSYPGVTTIGLTIRSGDRISAITDNQLSVIATRQIDGEDANTISGFLEYMRTDAGIPDSQFDSETIAQLEADYWTPRGETFDFIIDTQLTIEEVIDTALSAGMASRVDYFGKISAVREGPENIVGALTPHHMTSDLTVSMPLSQDDIYNGVDVKYVSSDTWEEETVECRIDGVTATKVEEISVDGITDETRAWRIGMRRLRKNIAQQYTVSGSTEMEVRNWGPYSRITVTDDMPNLNGISAEIYGFSVESGIATIAVREVFDSDSFSNPRIILIDHSGARSAAITPISISRQSVSFDSSLISFVPITDGSIDRATIMLCESTQLGYDITITSINPSSLTETDFEGIEYSDDIYSDDDNSPE